MNGPRPIDASMLDDRVEFERGMPLFAPVAVALSAVMAAFFAGELLSGALREDELLVAAGAKKTALVMAGEGWRLWSATLLHGDLRHLLSNAAALYLACLGCEHAFGWKVTLAAYAAAGGAATLASCAADSVSIGASGAVFGLLGLLAGALLRHRDRLALRDHRTGLMLALWAVYSIATGALEPRIDNLAHAGGLAAGAALSLLLVPRMLRTDPPDGAVENAAAGAAAAVLVYAGLRSAQGMIG